MRPHPSPDTLAQSEALVNEYKGHLFEFLVGQELAARFACRDSFQTQFSTGRRRKLAGFETWLRQNRPHLVHQLPLLAKECARHLDQVLEGPIQRVVVVGQWASAVDRSPLKEADLFLVKGESLIPVSLKLCKRESFVNTKSAGIFSFFNKYFATCNDGASAHLQESLNQTVHQSFVQMGGELYRLANLSFVGHFDSSWTKAGHPELPGQLPQPWQKVVSGHYQRVIKALHTGLKELSRSRQNFERSLNPLIGMGENQTVQAVCFHRGTDNYQLDSIEIKPAGERKALCADFQIMDYVPPLASFEIHMGHTILQIRVKPMNKFTVMGLKVNCSVKKRH